MYILNGLSYTIREDLAIEEAICDSLFIEIEQKSGKNLVIGTIYKAPSLDISTYVNAFDSTLQVLSREKKIVFLLGDFNIDILRHTSINSIQNCIDSLFSNFVLYH